jgi:Zn-dependent protease
MAQRFGDQTASWNGRLTLNPMAHIDPIGTIVLPLVGIVFGGLMFGWAKPVPIDVRQFSNYRKGLFWVSFAGPLSNILFGFLSTLAFFAVQIYLPKSFGYREAMIALSQSLTVVNFMLAVFNLLPIPPMDGSNIVLSFLNYNATRKFLELQQYSFLFMIALMVSGAFRFLAIPVMGLAAISESVARLLFGLA